MNDDKLIEMIRELASGEAFGKDQNGALSEKPEDLLLTIKGLIDRHRE